jgi:pimeloyl-ACP methyl ester carboxylesterase
VTFLDLSTNAGDRLRSVDLLSEGGGAGERLRLRASARREGRPKQSRNRLRGAAAGRCKAGGATVVTSTADIGITLDQLASRSRIQGNLIGTQRDGMSALGNWTGIEIFGSNNRIGGPGAAANAIAFNVGRGVLGNTSELSAPQQVREPFWGLGDREIQASKARVNGLLSDRTRPRPSRPRHRAGAACPRGARVRARYPDTEGYVERDGVRVFYEVYGERQETVCFLPTWPIMHNRAWKGQIPYLSRHFRVIAIDPRGNGRSDRPREPAAYSRDAHVGDVLAVLDEVGVERAMVVSISPRAPIGLALATAHPERVSAAVFVTPQLWVMEKFLSSFTAGERDGYDGYEKFNPTYWKRDFPGFVDWFSRTLFPHPHSTRQIEEMSAYALETDGKTLIAATIGFEMYTRDEALGLASEVRCPVLVTQNGGDAMWPKDCSGPLAEATRGRLHVFEGLGPAVGSRWPVAMNLALREFFEAVRNGTAAERVAVEQQGDRHE